MVNEVAKLEEIIRYRQFNNYNNLFSENELLSKVL